MNKIRGILRAKLSLGLKHREIARSVGTSTGVVSKVALQARNAQLDWAAIEALDDEALAQRLRGPERVAAKHRPAPDCAYVHVERKKPGVTLGLLHVEYLEEHPDGYGYSAYCERYRRWLKKHKLSMRQEHRAGEKLFVDYSGKKASYIGSDGQVVDVELFVATLGASNYTYVEATHTQQSVDFIASHKRALAFFGGVPQLLIPDQLKSGVTTSCRYEPGIQRTYEEFARHYGTAVLPARPHKPKDKSKVEVAVQVVQRWVLARLRNEVFSSLAALNARISELNAELNARTMRRYGKSRRELFEILDQPVLRPLPPEPFEHADFSTCRVSGDYMVLIDEHFYSVPHTLVGERVDIRLTATCVEVLFKHRRVASHQRSHEKGGITRVKAHMPKAHQACMHKPPSALIAEGHEVGVSTGTLVEAMLQKHKHPEKGYRPCLGLLRLRKIYSDERLERACARALFAGAYSMRSVKSILEKSYDALPIDECNDDDTDDLSHENIRGSEYYH